MAKSPKYMAEVGFKAADISPIGVGSNYPLTIPRSTILEPDGGGYIENDYYREDIAELGVRIAEHNIYIPQIPADFPLMVLLIMENVVNDPQYWSIKDFAGLFQFLAQVITPQGLVLFVDSIVKTSDLEDKYRRFKLHLAESNFDVVIDEWHSGYRPDVEQRQHNLELLVTDLKNQNSYDQAMAEGLNTLMEKQNRWLLLRQPTC